MKFEGFRSSVTAEVAPPPVGEWGEDSITYVTVTQDRVKNLKRNFPTVLPYVDRAVVVDGFSKDGSYEYLKSLGPKVEVYQRAWDDSFANQYNEYLKHIKGGWVLLCDDDEVPSGELLSSLREIISQSQGGTKFGVVEFRANDVSYVEGNWEDRVDNGPCEYYRQILFKWNPNMHYDVDLHQALQGMTGPLIRSKAHYYHIKSTKDELRNACRNYFIAGEWPGGGRSDGIRTAEWYEMKKVLSEYHPEVSLFNHLNGLLVSGNISDQFIEWIEKYRHHNEGIDGESSGELRAYARYWDLLK
jgi:glycosyltransferase involved in cell wall biosynthesis